MAKVYRFECEGFFGTVATVAEIAGALAELKHNHPSLRGQECRIYVGYGTVQCAMYPTSKPTITKTVE